MAWLDDSIAYLARVSRCFFFRAEGGIRDKLVTGVQTCALPILPILPNGVRMSLAARLTNVFSGPDEVFEAIAKGPPSTGNWLAPALLSCVLGIVSTMVIRSEERRVGKECGWRGAAKDEYKKRNR